MKWHLIFVWTVVLGRVMHRLKELAGDADSERLLADSFHGILERLPIPHVRDGSLVLDGFFTDLVKAGSAVDRNAKLYVGGGVIRSILGWLCQELLPVANVRAHLESLRRGPPLEAVQVLGVGSDVDLYYESTMGLVFEKALQEKANGAANYLGLKHANLSWKTRALINTIIPEADIVPIEKRFEVYAQGGSTLDMIYYDLTERTFLLPPKYPHLLRNFIEEGQFVFAPYDEQETSRLMLGGGHEFNPHKNCIRGLRPLLEIPSIQLDPASRERLLMELKALRKHLQTHPPRDSVRRQVGKMLRNSRFHGVDNIIWDRQDEIWVEARAIFQVLEPRRRLPYYAPPSAALGSCQPFSWFLQLDSLEDVLLSIRNGFPMQAGGMLYLRRQIPAKSTRSSVWIPVHSCIPNDARILRWKWFIPSFVPYLSAILRFFGIDAIIGDEEMILLKDFAKTPRTAIRFMEACQFAILQRLSPDNREDAQILQAFNVLIPLYRGSRTSTKPSEASRSHPSSPLLSLPSFLLRKAANFVYLPWALNK